MLDRILLVLDEPGDFRELLPHLRMLIRAGGSRVVVMKTVPFLETIVEMPGELSPQPECDDEAARVYLSAVVESLNFEDIEAEGFTNIGRNGLSIAVAAARVEASLIVVASQAHSRLAEFLLGDRVGTLLHAASIPVYVVPPSAPARQGRILVPVDETDLALEAVPTALALARVFRSGLLFLHVLGSGTQTAIFKARDLARREGISADLMIRQGEPAIEIPEVCREIRSRMIVMRSRALPGGVAQRLLHGSPSPLWIVRRADLKVEAREATRFSFPSAVWERRVRGVGF